MKAKDTPRVPKPMFSTHNTTEAELNRRADRLAERLRRDGFIVTLSLCVTAETAAKLLSVSPRTLRDWRKNDRGPRYVTTRRTWYPLVEIEPDTMCRDFEKALSNHLAGSYLPSGGGGVKKLERGRKSSDAQPHFYATPSRFLGSS